MGLTQVSTDGVKNDAITKTKIPANQIEASELADNAVDTAAIADDAVTAAKLADNAVVRANISDDAVNADKITAGGVDTNALGSDSVTTVKILNANVTTDKIADNAVTAGKLASGVQTTINNNADNRLITGSGTANTLEGESSGTFSSGQLKIFTDGASGSGIRLVGKSGNSGSEIDFVNNADNSNLGYIEYSDAGVRIWNLTNTDIHFRTNNTERMRILAGGGLTFNGDTAAANAISDYEEGTFTPTNTIGLTLTNNTTAHYTKIGRVVHIQIDCTFSGSADSSQCGIIQGLPFTSKSGCVNEGSLQFISNTSNGKFDYDEDNTRIFIGASESRIDIQNITGGTFQTRAFMVGRRFRIQMHYLTA